MKSQHKLNLFSIILKRRLFPSYMNHKSDNYSLVPAPVLEYDDDNNNNKYYNNRVIELSSSDQVKDLKAPSQGLLLLLISIGKKISVWQVGINHLFQCFQNINFT